MARSRSPARLKRGVGLLCAALFSGVAQSTSRPGTIVPCHTPCVPWIMASTPARPRPGVQQGPRRRSCAPRAARWSRARWTGRRGGPRPRQWWRVPVTGDTVAAWSRRVVGAARPVVRGGVRLWPAVVVRAAVNAVSQPRQARTGGPCEAGRSGRARWRSVRLPGACRRVSPPHPRPPGRGSTRRAGGAHAGYPLKAGQFDVGHVR